MDAITGAGLRGGSRTAQDACATLVEFTRALKGWRFYEPGSAARADLVDRAWRVFRGEIDRNGALALQVRRGTFWLAGTEVPVGTGRLDELARRLQERGVGRIAFDAEIESGALEAMLDALVADATEVVTAGGFEPVYFARSQRGISVNDTSWRSFVRSVAEIPTPRPDVTVPDLEPDAPLAIEDEPAGEPEPLDLLDALDPPDAPEAAPLEVAEEAASDEIGERLREFEECESDSLYRDAAHQLAYHVQSLVEQARFDDTYRVLERFALHASDDAKRSFAQRESARECLLQLGHGASLGDLVRRACADDTDASVHATGVLREIGAAAAPRLLDEIEREPAESERRRRLASALFALGEEAVPALAGAIANGSTRRQQAALRLAGESQNPRLVASLRDALLGGTNEVSREAAHALVRIGDLAALDVLAEALESAHAGVVTLAAQALATTGRPIAMAPLAAALDRSLAARDLSLARDLVRALGRLGRPEAAPVLADLLERGGFLERRRLREIKIAALHALAHVPGRAAEDALRRAEKHGEASQREAAALALRRRAHESAKANA